MCMGIATRSGCGALCPQVGMRCAGCYGMLDGVQDQGANVVGAVASVINAGSGPLSGINEAAMEREIEAVMDTLVDPAGTFYRFSMARALLHRVRDDGQGEKQ